jgi:hypothetical protein
VFGEDFKIRMDHLLYRDPLCKLTFQAVEHAEIASIGNFVGKRMDGVENVWMGRKMSGLKYATFFNQSKRGKNTSIYPLLHFL